MDIFVGYTGLAISFVIFAAILLWIFIKADNIGFKKKLLTVPLVLAYSIILYYIPVNFMGYASDDMEDVGMVIVLKTYVIEDDALYFLVIDYNKANVMLFFPRPVDSGKPTAPRLYKVVYNSDLHRKLLDAQARLKTQGRGGMLLDTEMLRGFSDVGLLGKDPFSLFDPAEILKKEPQQ